MAHKEVTCVEEKFNNLKLGKDTPKKKNKGKGKQQQSHAAMNGYKKNEHEDLHRQSSERDSANHSPADVMLASPSLSSISDNHSEVRYYSCAGSFPNTVYLFYSSVL